MNIDCATLAGWRDAGVRQGRQKDQPMRPQDPGWFPQLVMLSSHGPECMLVHCGLRLSALRAHGLVIAIPQKNFVAARLRPVRWHGQKRQLAPANPCGLNSRDSGSSYSGGKSDSGRGCGGSSLEDSVGVAGAIRVVESPVGWVGDPGTGGAGSSHAGGWGSGFEPSGAPQESVHKNSPLLAPFLHVDPSLTTLCG